MTSPTREEIKLRARTTLYDLLDDGVENGSDLPELARLRSQLEQDPPASVICTQISAKPPPAPGRRSYLGMIIGGGLMAAGAAMAVWPRDIMVMHARMKYLQTTVEHVSTGTARGYGLVLAVFGLLVLVVSSLRLRAQGPST